jgi:AcrR family transcriptional regulator
VVSFIRAHSAEQREVRRTAILDTARSMLEEMPVADITLNGLSRRACMAKSNVLRYFESREAVLLELCAESLATWTAELEPALAAAVVPADPVGTRIQRVADTIATSLAAHPTLCDLLSTQASVLERNISRDTVLAHKRASLVSFERLAALIGRFVPELGAERANQFSALAALMVTAVWTHAQLPPAVAAAYETDPSLQVMRLDFVDTLRDALEVLLAGLLSR